MSPLAWIYVLSATGAALFFVSGWLLASARSRAESEPIAARLRAELEETARALVEARRLGERREARLRELELEASLAGAGRDEAQRLLSAARESVGRSAVEIRALEERLREAVGEATARAAIQVECDELRAELDGARAAERQGHEKLAGLEAQIERARAAVRDAQAKTARTHDAERAAQAAASTLRDEVDRARAEGRDLLVQASAARGELLRAQAAAKALRAEIEATSAIAARVPALEEMIRALRPKALIADAWEAEVEGLGVEVRRLRAALSDADADADAADARLAAAAALAAQVEVASAARAAADERLEAAVAEAASLRAQALSLAERAADADRLRDEVFSLRSEAARRRAFEDDVVSTAGEIRELRSKVQALSGAATEARALRSENAVLRDEVRELAVDRGASHEVERTQTELRRARLEAELLQRRVDELVADRGETYALRERITMLERSVTEVDSLRVRSRELEARLYAVEPIGELFASEDALEPPPCGSVQELDATLGALVRVGAIHTAVLAEKHGLLVAGAGDVQAHEGLAALSGLVDDLAVRSRTLLPLAQVCSLQLADVNELVLSCRIFAQEGEEFVLATLGRSAPSSAEVARTVAALMRAMGGVEESTGEPPRKAG